MSRETKIALLSELDRRKNEVFVVNFVNGDGTDSGTRLILRTGKEPQWIRDAEEDGTDLEASGG